MSRVDIEQTRPTSENGNVESHDQAGPPYLPAHHPPSCPAHAAQPAALAGDQCRSLLADLAQLPILDGDPWPSACARRGLAVAVCMVLAGARSLAAIGEWARGYGRPGAGHTRMP